MENHEENNQNLISNVNPIGSGEIAPKQSQEMNNIIDNVNQNEENNK